MVPFHSVWAFFKKCTNTNASDVIPLGGCGALPSSPRPLLCLESRTPSVNKKGSSLYGNKAHCWTWGWGACGSVNLDKQRQEINTPSASRTDRGPESHSQLALLSLYSLPKLSYFPGKWMCCVFSKWRQESLLVVRDRALLPLWARIHAAPMRNIFIEPDIIHHHHDPLVSRQNTLDL